MNKIVVVVVVALIIIVGGAALIYANKGNPYNNPAPNTSTDMNNMNMKSKNSSSSSNPQATNSVTIQNFAFSPSAITVKKGTTVTWTNKDSTTHTVTEVDSKSGPNSGNLEPGKSYSFTFNTPGMFSYHCAIHTNMTGTVTVTE